MIKFFRKIRQQLLTENKFSKYLLYAIGEIVLVVIGILIALQINLWNEERKEREKECTYFESLISDLQNQIITIDSQVEFELDVIRDSEVLIGGYYSSNKFLVNNDFSRGISTLNNRMTFKESSSTYQELLSAGNMNVITNSEVKNKILNYYQMLNQFEDIISNNNSYIDNNFAPLVLRISTHSIPNSQINLFQNIISKGWISANFKENSSELSVLNDQIQKRLDNPLEKLKLLNDIKYRYQISGVHLSLMDTLKEQSEYLIKRIESELDGCNL